MNKSVEYCTSRREFIKHVGIGASVLALSNKGFSRNIFNKQKPDKPNLLIIHTDQQSSWTISNYPRLPGDQVVVQTPNIDSIAKNGARFDNFYSNYGVCTPSRACLMTGRYAQFTNAWQNDRPLKQDEITIAQALKDEGYDTGYCGKWHLSGGQKPGWGNPDWSNPDLNTYGFTEADFMWNRGHYKEVVEDPAGANAPELSNDPRNETTYTTDFFTDKTISFLKKSRTSPFFWMVSFPDPHTPYKDREPYASQYRPEDMSLPPTLNGINESTCRNRRTQYCGMVKHIDDCVGKIIQALKDAGAYDNTIIVFTTDHGDYMGEHGLYYKNKMYESAYRIPFLIQWPEKIAANQEIPSIVSNVDVFPTIFGLMGLSYNTHIHGNDASSLLTGEAQQWTDESFEFHPKKEHVGIFTPQWHLWIGKEGSTELGNKVPNCALFDRQDDPWQQNNLYDDPQHSHTRLVFINRLLAWHKAMKTDEYVWMEHEYGHMTKTESNKASASLHSNRCYPNPFNTTTTIEYTLKSKAKVAVKIFDTKGKVIRSLVTTNQQPGMHTVRWDGKDNTGRKVSAGNYLYKIILDGTAQSGRITFIH